MKWISRTHVGNVRSSNQDSVILGQNLYGVADGMGGHQAGDIASRMTAELLTASLKGLVPRTDTFLEIVRDINARVYARQKEDAALSGMGTTLTALWEADDAVLTAHVGDSRAYLLRGGELRQVTEDHSMVAEMVRQGLITEEEASIHPYRHVITRAIGTDENVEPDILVSEKQAGDRWLICSDGLTNCVTDAEIREHLLRYDLPEAADRLLLLALENGGNDNITLVITEVSA